MTMWRVGASPRALRNSCAVTRSPEALMRPEEKTTPDARSAKTNADRASLSLLAMEAALASRKEGGDIWMSGVYCSPWVVVRGHGVVVVR